MEIAKLQCMPTIVSSPNNRTSRISSITPSSMAPSQKFNSLLHYGNAVDQSPAQSYSPAPQYNTLHPGSPPQGLITPPTHHPHLLVSPSHQHLVEEPYQRSDSPYSMHPSDSSYSMHRSDTPLMNPIQRIDSPYLQHLEPIYHMIQRADSPYDLPLQRTESIYQAVHRADSPFRHPATIHRSDPPLQYHQTIMTRSPMESEDLSSVMNSDSAYGLSTMFPASTSIPAHKFLHDGGRASPYSVEGRRSAPPNEKIWECPKEECTRQFKRQEHLRRHYRSHTGERPYVCAVANCGRSFTRSDHLQHHVRTHTPNFHMAEFESDQFSNAPIFSPPQEYAVLGYEEYPRSESRMSTYSNHNCGN
jgi:hypothetical protein